MIFQRNVKLSALLFAIGFALSITWSNFAFALNEAPRTFTLDGRIYNSPTSSTPLLGAVTINVKILNPSGTCVLYEEEQPYNTTATKGYFNIPVGSVAGDPKRIGDDPNHTMETIYQNTALITAVNAGCGGGYTPSAGDTRLVRVTVTPTSTGIPQVFSPDMRLDAVPTAVVAESIQGLSRDNMLELNTNVELTQANMENVFSVANYPILTALLGGTSNLYMRASPSAAVSFNGQQITNVAAPTLGTDATNKTYVDGNIGGKTADTAVLSAIAAGDAGKVMVWDGTKWTAAAAPGDATKLPLAGGTMTGAINMGSQNLLATGHITMSSQTTLNLGTYTNAQETVLVLGLGAPDAGKFWYNADVPGLKVWNGGAAVAVQQSGSAAGGDLTGTYPNPTIAANAVIASKINDGAVTGAKILDATITGSDIASSTITDTNIAGVGAGKITSGAGVYFTYAPNGAACVDGQYMRWDNINTRWVCGTPTDNGITALTGDVTASGNGSVAATISNDAVTNTKIASLAVTNAKINDVSYNKLSNGAGVYLNYMPNNAACADGQVLSWDNTNSRWVCASGAVGSVVGVATGTGLTGGTITSSGTISIASGGVGTTELANNSVTAAKLNDDAVTSAKILDGTIATIDIADNAITDVKINSGAVTTPKLFANPGANYLVMTDGVAGSTLVSKSCAINEILKWTITGWTCSPDDNAGGTVTSFATGTGLAGGPISTTGTISIAAGGVSATELASNAVTNAKLNDGAVDSAKILDGTIATVDIASNAVTSVLINALAITDSKVNDIGIDKLSYANGKYFSYRPNGVACADGEVISWDNANARWVCGSPSSGSVTSIATGTGLTGGPINSTGTISIASNAITTALMNDAAVTAVKLNDDAVTSAKILDGTIGLADLSSTITDGLWTAAGGNVYRSTGNVGIGTTSPLMTLDIGFGSNSLPASSGTVPNGSLRIGNAGTNMVLDFGVTSLGGSSWIQSTQKNNLANAHNLLLNPNGGDVGIGTTSPNSKLTVEGVTALGETAAPAATAGYGKLYVKSSDSKLYFMDDAGLEKNISDSAAGGTVTGIATGTGLSGGPIGTTGTISIAAGGVSETELAAAAVTNAKLNDGAVDSAKVLDGSIASADLAAKAITTALINDSAVTALQLNNDAVTSAKILDGTIALADLSSAITDGFWTASGGNVYRSTGNVGIGTTNPASKLEVNGTFTSQGNIVANGGFNWFYTNSGTDYVSTSGSASIPAGTMMSFRNTGAGANDYAGISIGNSYNGGTNAYMGAITPSSGYTPVVVIGQQTGATAYTERLRIDANGNFGIGTTSPNEILTVQGAASLAEVAAPTATAGYGKLYVKSADSKLYFMDDAGLEKNISDSAAGGTVTGIATGTGLSGGPIGTTGTISIAVGGVSETELASAAVTNAKLNDGAVDSAKILDGTIATVDINAKAITTALINDSAVTALQLNDDAVTSAKILDGTIALADLSSAITDGLWTASSGNVYRSSGNVGIGTTLPGQKLTVNQSSDTSGIRVYGSSVPSAYFDLFVNNSGNPRFYTPNVMVFQGDAGQYFRTSGTNAINIQDLGTGSIVMAMGGGNVGIGNPSPGARLSVIGTTSDSSAPALNVGNSSLNSLFYVRNDGFIGVGTANPIATLDLHGPHVNGTVPFTQLSYDTAAVAQDVGGGIGFGGKYSAVDSLFGGVRGGKENSTSGDNAGYLSFYTRVSGANLSERLRISSGGNVGIGTTAPNALLTVAGVTSLGETTAPTATAGYGKLYVKSADSKLYFMDDSGLEKNISDSAAGGTVTGIATGTGLTGGPIGTTGTISIASNAITTALMNDAAVTNAKLNDGAVDSAKILDGTIASADLSAKAITTALINDSAVTALQLNADAVTSAKILDGTIALADLSTAITDGLWTVNGSDVYRSSGNVGIGTTSPSQKLDVTGTIRSVGSISTNGGAFYRWDTDVYTPTSSTYAAPNGGGNLRIANSNGNVGGQATSLVLAPQNNSSNQSAFIGAVQPPSGNRAILVFGQQTGATAYAEQMRLDENGNFGIGTTAPNSLFTVAGVAALGETAAPTATAGYGKLYVKSADSKLYFMDDAGLEKNISDSAAGGTVTGIATGTGLSGGPIGTTGTISIAAGGVSETELASNAVTASKINDGAVTSTGILDGAIMAADLNSTITSGLWSVNGSDIYRSSGKVGIGTTAPANTLEVQGTSFAGSAFTGSASGVLAVVGDALNLNDVVAMDFRANDYGSDAMARIGMKMNGAGSYLQFGTSSNFGAGITNTALVIDPNGNVGIGTTAPTSYLTVAGAPGALSSGITFGDGDSGIYESADDVFRISLAGTDRYYLVGGSFYTATGQGPMLNAGAGFASVRPRYTEDAGLGWISANKIGLSTGTHGNAIVIDGGNVGVGTTEPNALLTVAGVAALGETAAPTNTAGYGKLYVKSADSKLYFMDDSGVESDLTAAAAGGVWATNGTDVYRASGNVGIGTTAPTAMLGINSGTVVANTPLLNLKQTWNNAGTAFKGITFDATDNASAQSLFIEMQVGGSPKFQVDKWGAIYGGGYYVGTTSSNTGAFLSSGLSLSYLNYLQWTSGPSGSGNTPDLKLWRDGAGILAQQNGTNAQSYRSYNSYTDASNYERAVIDWQTTSNVLRIGTEAAGTGSVRNVALVGGNVGIGSTTPNSKLTVEGVTALGETTAPTQTAGYGKLYVKSSDSKLYFMDDAGVETDLLASSGITGLATGTGLTGGPISGTGTISLDSTVTDALWTANSGNVYRSTGSVGVGTTAPATALDVVGTVRTSQQFAAPGGSAAVPGLLLDGATDDWGLYVNGGSLGFGRNLGVYHWNMSATDFSGNGGVGSPNLKSGYGRSATHPTYTFNSDGNTGVFNPADEILGFSTNGSERVRIDSSGNVGIGTTSPSEKLHLPSASKIKLGDYISLRNIVDSGLIIQQEQNVSNGNSILEVRDQGSSVILKVSEQGDLDTTSTTGSIFTLGRNDTTATANDSIGKVQFWNNDSTSTTQKIYGDIEVTAAQDITTDAAAGNMIFRTTGTTVAGSPIERMRIDSSGNVGIGTTTTNSLLTVAGVTSLGETTAPSFTAGYGKLYVKSSDSKLYFMDDSGAETDLLGSSGITGLATGTGLAGGPITGTGTISLDSSVTDALWTANSGNVYRSSGNVGVGTTAPAYPLDVVGNMGVSGTNFTWNGKTLTNTSNNITFTSSHVIADFSVGVRSNRGNVLGMDQSAAGINNLGLFANSIERMTIASTGNVGIGTTGPTQPLDVVGNINTSGSIMINANSGFYRSGNNLIFNTAGLSKLNIATSGLTIEPGTPLRWGATNVFDQDTSISRLAASTLSVGNGTAGTSGGTFIAGTIGVGTTSPVSKLEVAGAAMADSDLLIRAVEDGNNIFSVTARDGASLRVGASRGLSINQDGSPRLDLGVIGSAPALTAADHLGMVIAGREDDTGTFGVALLNDVAMPAGIPLLKVGIGASDATTEYMRISDTGQMGIGTTAPNSLLTVAGVTALGETTAPSLTAGYGKLYVKSSDSKLYFMDDSGAETDLLAGGGVTGIATGTGLTGGPITSTGTISLATSVTDALWTANSGNVYRSSGNVGIGTTSPTAPLSLSGFPNNNSPMVNWNDGYGTGAITGASGNVTITPSASANWAASFTPYGVLLRNNASFMIGAASDQTQGLGDTGISRGAAAQIYIGNGTAGNSSGTLVAAGIGVGTTSPASALDLSSTTGGIFTLSRNDTTALANDSIGKLQFWNNDATSTTQKIFGNIEVTAAQDITTDAAAGNMIFRTTGTTAAGSPVERMRINAAGNVGIGTTAPTSKLEVNGRIVSTVGVNTDALTSITADFSAANMIRATGASAACGTLNITNTAAGGSFTVTIANATNLCTTIQWNGVGTNVIIPSSYVGGTAVTGVVYTFIDDGANLWVSYVPF